MGTTLFSIGTQLKGQVEYITSHEWSFDPHSWTYPHPRNANGPYPPLSFGFGLYVFTGLTVHGYS